MAGDRVDAELGYGLPVGARLVGTPRAAVSTSQYGRDLRMGYTLGEAEREADVRDVRRSRALYIVEIDRRLTLDGDAEKFPGWVCEMAPNDDPAARLNAWLSKLRADLGRSGGVFTASCGWLAPAAPCRSPIRPADPVRDRVHRSQRLPEDGR